MAVYPLSGILRAVLSTFLSHASNLRNVYWRIRACRSANRRRNWYRIAAKEKGHLVALGYSVEVVRLYALYLRNPHLERRLNRFEMMFHYYLTKPADPVQLLLF